MQFIHFERGGRRTMRMDGKCKCQCEHDAILSIMFGRYGKQGRVTGKVKMKVKVRVCECEKD